MRTRCCLIAVGGRGHRLKTNGVEFPYSKSSLQLSGKPMIYWLLSVLERVGIEKVVMSSERNDSLEFVKGVVGDNFINKFESVLYHVNPGLGVTGLPYQAKNLLDFPCFFEAGHSFQKPEHYKDMDRQYEEGCYIISGFPPKGHESRFVVKIEDERIKYVGRKFAVTGETEVGIPRIVGTDFVDILPKLSYRLSNIIPYYIENNKLKVVLSDMPLEVDVREEWIETIPHYKRFIDSYLSN